MHTICKLIINFALWFKQTYSIKWLELCRAHTPCAHLHWQDCIATKHELAAGDESVNPMVVPELIYFVIQWHIIVMIFSGTQKHLVKTLTE